MVFISKAATDYLYLLELTYAKGNIRLLPMRVLVQLLCVDDYHLVSPHRKDEARAKRNQPPTSQ